MKKCMLKGMALLSMGFAFVACSHESVYDENHAEKERTFDYDQAFTQEFGTIAKGHKWGFDQTAGFQTQTRSALTSSPDMWKIPVNLEEGRKNMQGWNANAVADKFASNDPKDFNTFTFDNYWLQHVDMPQGNDKHKILALEAYNSNLDKWEVVTNFTKGKDTDDFVIESTYAIAGRNRVVEVATLMVDMGGKPDKDGNLFRVKMQDGDNIVYNTDYSLLTCEAYHKKPKKQNLIDSFLAFRFLNLEASGKTSYWVIRLEAAVEDNDMVLKEGRVLCEDMGANDFDFNDVVFDAWILKNGDIRVRVLAHGGKLPIFIDDNEVKLSQMTNTGLNDQDPYEFTIAAKSANTPKYSNIEDIPVTVTPNGGAENSYTLGAPIGSAPQKICAPIGANWPDEYVPINEAYNDFSSWVNSNNPRLWILNVVPNLVDGNMDNNQY